MKIACSFLLMVVAGCSSVQSTPPAQTPLLKINSIELYLGRASYTKAEFEQFKISESRLFSECGEVVGGRQVPKYQNVQKLTEDDNLALQKASTVLLDFTRENELKLDPPGNATSTFDGGSFKLKVRTSQGNYDVNTTLDGVTDITKTSEDLLKKMATAVREIASRQAPGYALCGNRKFYDL